MHKLIKKFCIALLSLTALSTVINVQKAKADDIYDKCYKFDRFLNKQELEYCRLVKSHQIGNYKDAEIYQRRGIYNNTDSNYINNVESITNIGCGIHCWNQIRLEEKQRKEEREHKE